MRARRPRRSPAPRACRQARFSGPFPVRRRCCSSLTSGCSAGSSRWPSSTARHVLYEVGGGYPAPHRRADRATAQAVRDGLHAVVSAYLHRSTAKRLEGIFGDYLPDAEAKDFYEMEIASTGMMRSFVAVPCDMYFTVERKIARFLECALKLCNVPPERRRGSARPFCSSTCTPWRRASSERPSSRRKRALKP